MVVFCNDDVPSVRWCSNAALDTNPGPTWFSVSTSTMMASHSLGELAGGDERKSNASPMCTCNRGLSVGRLKYLRTKSWPAYCIVPFDPSYTASCISISIERGGAKEHGRLLVARMRRGHYRRATGTRSWSNSTTCTLQLGRWRMR